MHTWHAYPSYYCFPPFLQTPTTTNFCYHLSWHVSTDISILAIFENMLNSTHVNGSFVFSKTITWINTCVNTLIMRTLKYFCLYLASATPAQLLICLSSIKVSLKGKLWGSNTPKLLTTSDIGLSWEIVKS